MPIQGHPPLPLLDRFAAGALPVAAALVVACHLEACPACRARVDRRETEAGEALEALPDTPMRPDALDRALARLDLAAPAPPSVLGDVPLPEALGRQGLHARRFIGPDFWAAPVKRSQRQSWRAYVLRAPARARIPAHRHLGTEYFQVLMGEVSDGRDHAAGDFVVAPAGEHALEVGPGGPCACLIAVEHGAQWRGVARLLSPWLGI